MKLKQVHNGVEWEMEVSSVGGTWVTLKVLSHIAKMYASVLEFSLWDATCKQIPSLTLSDDNIELLRPWLKAKGFPWRLEWNRRTTRKAAAAPKEDPRQGKLPWG